MTIPVSVSRWAKWPATLVLLVPALVCIAQPPSTAARTADRRFASGRWVEQALALRGAAPIALGQPLLIAADRSRVYLYDYEADRLLAFGLDGTLAWTLASDTAGRPFRNPTSLNVDAAGTVWLLDFPAATAHAVSSEGKIVTSIRVPRTVWRLVPGPGDTLLAWSDGPKKAEVLRMSRQGRVLDILQPEPTSAGLDTLPSLVRESFIASSRRGQFLEAYRWSDRVRLWSATARGRIVAGPGDTSFPDVLQWSPGGRPPIERVDPRAIARTRGVAADDTLAYVLRWEDASMGRIVDVYRFQPASYAYSLTLPEPVVALASVRGGVVGVTLRPAARLRHWRWIPERGSRVSVASGMQRNGPTRR